MDMLKMLYLMHVGIEHVWNDMQAEFEAEQEKLKQLSYLSAAEQKKFADRQSIAFMYMKPPGYDAAQKRTEQVQSLPKALKTFCCSSGCCIQGTKDAKIG